MSGNLVFNDLSRKLFSSRAAIAGIQAFGTALRICWRSILEYSGNKRETVERFKGVEDFGRVKVSRAETSFLRPRKEVEKSFISSKSSYSVM